MNASPDNSGNGGGTGAGPEAAVRQDVRSDVPASPAGETAREGHLEDDLEAALGDFRHWLAESQADAGGAGLPLSATALPELDLATLLGHFIALRQEINLQTRAVRAQQEQSGETLGRLQQALDLAVRNQARAEQAERAAADDKTRPLLSTLADLYDSLAMSAAPIRRATTTVLPRLQEMLAANPDEAAPDEPGQPAEAVSAERSFWSRWILSPTADAALRASRERAEQALARLRRDGEIRHLRATQTAAACEQVQGALSALLAGYTMNLERVARSLRKHGLEPIEAVGAPFDPERMEVIDGVVGSGRPAGEVVEEVQRGYTVNGRVFRYARVRVARD